MLNNPDLIGSLWTVICYLVLDWQSELYNLLNCTLEAVLALKCVTLDMIGSLNLLICYLRLDWQSKLCNVLPQTWLEVWALQFFLPWTWLAVWAMQSVTLNLIGSLSYAICYLGPDWQSEHSLNHSLQLENSWQLFVSPHQVHCSHSTIWKKNIIYIVNLPSHILYNLKRMLVILIS